MIQLKKNTEVNQEFLINLKIDSFKIAFILLFSIQLSLIFIFIFKIIKEKIRKILVNLSSLIKFQKKKINIILLVIKN